MFVSWGKRLNIKLKWRSSLPWPCLNLFGWNESPNGETWFPIFGGKIAHIPPLNRGWYNVLNITRRGYHFQQIRFHFLSGDVQHPQKDAKNNPVEWLRTPCPVFETKSFDRHAFLASCNAAWWSTGGTSAWDQVSMHEMLGKWRGHNRENIIYIYIHSLIKIYVYHVLMYIYIDYPWYKQQTCTDSMMSGWIVVTHSPIWVWCLSQLAAFEDTGGYLKAPITGKVWQVMPHSYFLDPQSQCTFWCCCGFGIKKGAKWKSSTKIVG